MTVIARRTCAALVLAMAVAVVVAVTAGGLSPASAAASGDRSFAIVSLETDATVAPDGSMTVTELVTYRFDGGPFRRGSRTFASGELDRIQDFTAEEDGQLLTVVPPPESELDGYRWLFPAETSDSTHTYTLRYRVPDAVTIGSDVGELYWQFVGDEHPGIGSVRVDVTMPASFDVAADDTPDTDATVLRAWAHGPSNGRVDLTPDHVMLSVDDVPGGSFVEARIAIPAAAFTGAATSGSRLPTILAEERAFIEGKERDRNQRDAGMWLSLVATVLGAFGLGGVWRRYGREPEVPSIGEYWREPLDDPPAVVLATLDRGGIDAGKGMASTLIDLAQRGHLTIAEHVEEQWGPDERTHTFTRRTRIGDPPAPFERHLLDYVFADADTVSSTDIEERAKDDQPAAKEFLEEWKEIVGASYAAKGYGDPGGARQRWWWLAGIVVLLAIAGAVALLLGSLVGLVPLIAIVPLVVTGVLLLRNRSMAGAEATAKAKGLQRFLQDFSHLKDAPAGHLILWERYLVYAVALGVSRELLNGLATRMPQLLAEPAFGAWYVGYGPGRLDHLPDFPGSFESSTMAAIAPPSSTGSGGGFSGGGGGGGGGGGFGAD
ncbi:MAG: DUF2207 domain-containing protein [Acidimicrobiia bacterium]